MAGQTVALMDRGYTDAIRLLLKHMMKSGEIQAVFCLASHPDRGVSYSLISQSEDLDRAVPFYPVMPGNGGKLLSGFTMNGPSPIPIAAVLRPCELRAFVELEKREQGSSENLIIISSTCGGVFPLRDAAADTGDDILSRYNAILSPRNTDTMQRDACRICERFEPHGADMTFCLAGNTDPEKASRIILTGDRMKEIASAAGFSITGHDGCDEGIGEIGQNRKTFRDQYYSTHPMEQPGLEGLMEILGTCAGCRGCSNVCPICYCETCFFRSAKAEHKNFVSIKELEMRGGMKLPPLLTLFHLGRMTHMAHSCVGCGMCSDVCPVHIPVGPLFQKAGEAADLIFDYEPGRDVEESPPLSTFQVEELLTYGE